MIEFMAVVFLIVGAAAVVLWATWLGISIMDRRKVQDPAEQ